MLTGFWPKAAPRKKSPPPRRVLARCFWGARDQQQLLDEVVALVDGQIAHPQPIYAGDNMVAIGRNMCFLNDAKFMASFASVITPANHTGQAIMWRIHVYCWAAKQGLRRPGDFVECGVAAGSMAAIMCAYLDFQDVAKRLFLIDAWDTDARVDAAPYAGNSMAYVKSVFEKYPNVVMTPGYIPEVFSTSEMPEQIAFLHVDLNSAPAEIAALEGLFERMSPGAILLLDDFGHCGFRATQNAEIEWLAKRGYTAVELPTGQGLVVV